MSLMEGNEEVISGVAEERLSSQTRSACFSIHEELMRGRGKASMTRVGQQFLETAQRIAEDLSVDKKVVERQMLGDLDLHARRAKIIKSEHYPRVSGFVVGLRIGLGL